MLVKRSGIYEKIPVLIIIITSILVIIFNLSTIYIFINFIVLVVAIILLGESSIFPFKNKKRVGSWVCLYFAIFILIIFINHIITSDQSNIYMLSLTGVLTVLFALISGVRGWVLTIKLF